MDHSQLATMGLSEAAALIATRQVSPLELAEACIERALLLDPLLHVYLTPTFETALAEARAATDAIGRGEYRGPLHGIPFAIKDLFDTEGVRTTAGSRPREDNVPSADAHAVARLKQAGAVLLGKLALHEWAMGGTNVTHFYPSPRNPWDLERVTGGSSGGSGAAVAAGLCLGTLGTDTRGSVRVPAAFCGVTGLKPTYGRVSLRGVVPLNWSLDHVGPLARSAADCALILEAIAGFDPNDPTSADVPAPAYASGLQDAINGLRIGVPREFFFASELIQPDVARLVRNAIPVFQHLGAVVEEVDFPDPSLYQDEGAFGAESAAYHEENVKQHPEQYSEPIRRRVLASLETRGIDYARARWRQAQFRLAAREVFESVDIVLTPTVLVTALTFAEAEQAPPALLARNTTPFNLLGVPTISVPCGFDSRGLPVGLSLSAAWWQEGTLLRVAHAYQQATDWHKQAPQLVVSE